MGDPGKASTANLNRQQLDAHAIVPGRLSSFYSGCSGRVTKTETG